MFLVTGASNMQRKWCGIENLLWGIRVSSAALYTSTQAEAHVISRVHVSGVSMFPVSWNRYPAEIPSEVSHSTSWQGRPFTRLLHIYPLLYFGCTVDSLTWWPLVRKIIYVWFPTWFHFDLNALASPHLVANSEQRWASFEAQGFFSSYLCLLIYSKKMLHLRVFQIRLLSVIETINLNTSIPIALNSIPFYR